MIDFCPQCGNKRTGQLRFCRGCGFDFDAIPIAEPRGPRLGADGAAGWAVVPPLVSPPAPALSASTTAPASSVAAPTNLPMLAGIAWLVAAGLTGFLAYQQWTVGQLIGSSDLQATALWNALACVITLYFAARLIGSPSRQLLDRSAAWAVLSVLSGVLQMTGVNVGDVFAASVIAAAVAGSLSWVGRQQFPRNAVTLNATPPAIAAAPGPNRWDTQPSAAPVTAPTSGGPVTTREGSGLRGAEILVVGLIVVAIVGGGYLLMNSGAPDGTGGTGTTTTPRPTTRATTRPVTAAPAGVEIAEMGEAVELVDGDGADLGSTTVLEASKPKDLFGPAPEGYQYVAAKVRYAAVAAWTYTLFDWAAHDGSDRQYEPLGYAPEPVLSGGTLAPGKKAEGWVAFQVPAEVDELWLDLMASDGTIIFSVRLP